MNAKRIAKCTALIIGVIVIPLLYSYFYLGAFWDPYNTLGDVPVAVVNSDKGAAINGKTRNLGREAADKLVKNDTLRFILTDAQKARAGALGGKYYAVITFPQNFSKNIATVSTTHKVKAQVVYSPNKKRNYIASQIMKNVVTKIEESTRGSVDKEITAELSSKLRKVPGDLKKLRNGLSSLSDGAGSLTGGIRRVSSGQGSLLSGARSLQSGIGTLYTGSKTLGAGASELSGGVSKVLSGSRLLSSSASGNLPSLTSGVTALNTGAQTLFKQFSSGTSSGATVYDGVTGVADGTSALAKSLFSSSGDSKNPSVYDGVTQVAAGVTSLQKSLFSSSGDSKNPSVYDGITQVAAGVSGLQTSLFSSSGDSKNPSVYDGVESVKSGTDELSSNLNTYVSGVNGTLYAVLAAEDRTTLANMAAYYGNLYATASDAAHKSAYGNLYLIYSAAAASSSQAAFETALSSSENLVSSGSALTSGGTTLAAGAKSLASQFEDGGTLKTGVATLGAGTKSLSSQFSDGGTLKTSVATLGTGAQSLASQFENGGTLKTSVTALDSGAQTVAAQFKTGGAFRTGMQQLTAGTQTLSSGTAKLGVLGQSLGKLTAALTQLRAGAAKLSSGSAQLSSGIASAKSGSASLTSGAAKLSSAGEKLESGASALSKGIRKAHTGVKKSVTSANKETKSLNGLSSYAQSPVKSKEQDLTQVPNYGTAFAPYFMSLSLWVGALLMFFGIYLDADERIKVLSRHSQNKFVRVGAFCLIGVAQAVILALIVQYALGLAIADVPAFYLSCVLISLVFISIVEFLIVNLKDLGKFLSIAFLVLQLTSCGGTFPMETVPKFFNVLYPYMPMTYSVNLLKECTSDFRAASAWSNAGVLIGIFALFTGLTMVLSITRRAKRALAEKVAAQA